MTCHFLFQRCSRTTVKARDSTYDVATANDADCVSGTVYLSVVASSEDEDVDEARLVYHHYYLSNGCSKSSCFCCACFVTKRIAAIYLQFTQTAKSMTVREHLLGAK